MFSAISTVANTALMLASFHYIYLYKEYEVFTTLSSLQSIFFLVVCITGAAYGSAAHTRNSSQECSSPTNFSFFN